MKHNNPLQNRLRGLEGLIITPVRFIALIAVVCATSALAGLAGQPILLKKGWRQQNGRIHPYSHMLLRGPESSSKRDRGPNYNRLLVILVEFQQEIEDDPNTTGDGRFQTEADPDYLYSIAKPPHDRQYFMTNLEALRYYYLAVSCGSYDLEYDVFPEDGSKIVLPNTMGYYNPPEASSSLFTQRMEEYFGTSFTLADQNYPEIDFGSYDHYMIIHAGSDWQHDIFGDTPSDIPSFFIRVGADKAVSVDNGTHLITHACNVPATISQDFRTEDSNGATVHNGYGALNAVIAHEFGHSLGLVDLYNVYNFQPMVGVFDLMDSGGSGVLVDQLNDGSLVMVEGILPALPGAFSRTLLFGEYFEQNGYLKQISDVELFNPMSLAASSLKQTTDIRPSIYTLPLTDREYILIENRSVDPDNDGATAVFGALDGRVILYPTPINDPLNQPSYEYDYLLPSFQRSNGDAVGGGMLVWLVNNDVIYEQGVQYPDGEWASNFDNNTVNTSYLNRGVQVVEADGLADIGNEWSWYWTGTQYEYFHKYKPVLDTGGFFQSWSLTDWKPVLGPTSDPALSSTDGVPALHWLASIGNPGPVMSFELRSGFFDDSQIIDLDAGSLVAPVIDTSFGPDLLPVISNTGIRLFNTDSEPWQDLMGEFPYTGAHGSFPVTRASQTPNQYHELILTLEDRIRVMEFWNDALDVTDIDIGGPPAVQALAVDNYLFAATSSSLFQISGNMLSASANVSNAKRIAVAGNDILVLQPNGFMLLESATLGNARNYPLDAVFGRYEPVIFQNTSDGNCIIFLLADNGDVWKWQDGQAMRVFTNVSTSLPTQMGITALPDRSPLLFFGLGSSAYVMMTDGTLLDGFPYQTGDISYEAFRHVYSTEFDNRAQIQLPVPDGGYYAITTVPGTDPVYSLSLPGATTQHMFHIDYSNDGLYWLYVDQGELLCYNHTSLSSGRILWNGARNASLGQFSGAETNPLSPSDKLTAYVYPNPVQNEQLRIKATGIVNNPVEIKVFDVAGNLVLKGDYSPNGMDARDFQFSHSLASGVYFLTIKNGPRNARVKFAVIN